MSVRANIAVLLFGIVLAVTGARATSAAASAGSLDQAFAILQDAEFVDLTHEFSPTTPHWKGFAPETVTTLFTIAKDGFRAEGFCHPRQLTTHLESPAT